MADQAKKTNPKPKNDTNPGKNMETSIYSERLKAAVNDAQYLVEYVAEKHLQNINHRTINTLVDAKRFIEDEHGFNSEKESNFWLAYHELCSQISPVTIESIKASLPIGRFAANRPVSENLGITGLLKKINVSRVNVAMFFSVTLTILALLVVLFFQIYWVVGDQLSTQLENLQKTEKELASQTYEDQQSYAKDAESLKTQIVQTSLAFLKWSDLWKKYVPKSNWNFSSRNQQRVFEIEAELQDINNKISIDPTGTKEAENHRDVLDLINTQITKNENIAQGMKDNITKKGQLAEKQNSLKNELNYLDGLIAEVQKKIKKQEDEIEADKAKLAELKTDREIRLETLGKLQNELTSQLNDLKTSNNLKVDEPTDDESLRTCSGGETTQQEKVDQCNTTLKQLDAIETQQKNAVNESADEQLLRQKIDNGEKQLVVEPNNSIDPFVAAVNSYIDSSDKTETLSLESLIGVMQGQSITLATQLDSLSLAREFIQGKIEYLQSGIEQISIDISIIQNNNDSDGKTELNKKIEAVGIQISSERNQQIKKLEAERYDKQVEILKENSGSDQLEGQFVLDILENNILPLLYGILGALTFALRTLARQIKSVTYSGAVGAQHVSHIALGALAGILVGWFSNLLTNDSFLSSVSPFAIAFLVGYNIELVFLKMDEYVVTRISKTQEKTLPAIGNTGIASTTQINHPEQESTPVEAPDKENPVE